MALFGRKKKDTKVTKEVDGKVVSQTETETPSMKLPILE